MEENKVADIPVSKTEAPVEKSATVEPVKTTESAVETITKVEAKEKVFTQAQLDEIVVGRLGKEKVRMLKKLGIDDESKIDDILSKANLYDSVKSEADSLKQEKLIRTYGDELSALGVDSDFIEFVLGKVDKGENLEQFKVNATKFVEENPKFKKDTFKTVNSNLDLGGVEAYPDFEKMTTEQYLKWREKNKL